MRLRFTIRDLLWLTALMAMGFGWWVDRHSLDDKLTYSEMRVKASEGRIDALEDQLRSSQRAFFDVYKKLHSQDGQPAPN
jgi:hypothetical protein